MSDWEQFFKRCDALATDRFGYCVSTEALYQAFKARMKEEDAKQIEKPIKDYPLEGQDG